MPFKRYFIAKLNVYFENADYGAQYFKRSLPRLMRRAFEILLLRCFCRYDARPAPRHVTLCFFVKAADPFASFIVNNANLSAMMVHINGKGEQGEKQVVVHGTDYQQRFNKIIQF